MPMMLMLQTRRIASTSGHAVQFTSKVPHFVPREMVRECLHAGAVICDESGQIVADDDTTVKRVEFAGDLRVSLLYLLYQRLIKENKSANFTSGQVPKVEIVSRCLAFDVNAKEVKKTWQDFQTAINSGGDLKLHKDAQMVLDIIDANDNSDLQLLAAEMNVPEDETSGLTSRDLRALLLTKFDGLTNATK